jgi:pimeloyl-ACP methyl ester carboxylesterase
MWQTPEVGEQIMEAMVGDALVDALADQLGREYATEVARNVDETMKDCILRLYRSAAGGFAEWHDAVDAIDRPGVVLWGADDPYVTPEFGERLAKRTGAGLVMFADSGHWWPVTKPAEVATALESLWG